MILKYFFLLSALYMLIFSGCSQKEQPKPQENTKHSMNAADTAVFAIGAPIALTLKAMDKIQEAVVMTVFSPLLLIENDDKSNDIDNTDLNLTARSSE